MIMGHAYLLPSQIIADHTVVDRYSDIPQQYINAVKSMLISIPGESHATGYLRGLFLLEEMESRYQVEIYNVGAPSAGTNQYLRAGRHREAGEYIFFSQEEAMGIKNEMLAQDATGNPFDVMGFGWCYDMTRGDDPGGGLDPDHLVHWAGRSEGSPEGSMRWGLDSGDQALTGNSVSMDTYLEAMESFNAFSELNAFPTRWIYTTGPVDRDDQAASENGFQREIKHAYIRAHVAEDPGRVLFDYADILCWNNEGEQHLTNWIDGGNIRTHAHIHPDNMMDYDNSWNPVPHVEDGDHIGEVGTVRLAKAMWWLLARMAGWDGTGGTSSEAGELPASGDPDLSIHVGSDFLQVSTSGIYDRGKLRLYDLQGRLCREMDISGNKTEISMDSFPAGAYLVLVSKDEHMESGKVVLGN